MSITRALLRLATVHALIDRTLAEDAVFDSIIDPTDARISDDGKRPIIAVYTDDQGGEPVGHGDYLHGSDLDLVIEIVCAGRVQVSLDDDDGGQSEYQISIPNTDAGLEITLDLIEAQVVQALVAGTGDWSEVWRLLSTKVTRIMSQRGASSEGGTRFAARRLTITTDTLTDPDRGDALAETGPWLRALRLLGQNSETAAIAEILLAELEGKAKTEWRRAAARLGVNLSTISAIGLGPVGAEDPVPLVDGIVEGDFGMNALVRLYGRMAEMERKLAASHRQGMVAKVDPALGVVRLDLGDGMLSPWIPYVQTAGALKVHSPPSVGQIMAMIAPSGETEQGFATALSFGAGNSPPSTAPDQHVISFGDVLLTLSAGGISAVIGGVIFSITAAGVEITGGEVRHNGVNIGSTHRHGGVDRGNSSTEEPE